MQHVFASYFFINFLHVSHNDFDNEANVKIYIIYTII